MRFTIILEATDATKARRQVLVRAADASEARRIVEAREAGFAAYHMTTDEWSEAEAAVDDLAVENSVRFPRDASLPVKLAVLKDAGVKVHPTIRANVAVHEQAKPYKVVSVKPTDGPEPATDPEGGDN